MYGRRGQVIGGTTLPTCKKEDDKVVENCGKCSCNDSGVSPNYNMGVCTGCGKISPGNR